MRLFRLASMIALVSFPLAANAQGLRLPGSHPVNVSASSSAGISGIVKDDDASVGSGDKTMVVFLDYGIKQERSQILEIMKFSQTHPDWKINFKELPLVTKESLDIALAQVAVVAQQDEIAWRKFEIMVVFAKDTLTPETLRKIAQQSGVNMPAYDETLSSGRAMAKLRENRNIAMSSHIDGTPFFAIDGKVKSGMMSASEIASFAGTP